MQFARKGWWGGCCLRITLGRVVRLRSKVCAQARGVVSKVEEEKRSEEQIGFLGHQGPTARLHRQLLVVQWKKSPALAEQQQRLQQQNRRSKKAGRWSKKLAETRLRQDCRAKTYVSYTSAGSNRFYGRKKLTRHFCLCVGTMCSLCVYDSTGEKFACFLFFLF